MGQNHGYRIVKNTLWLTLAIGFRALVDFSLAVYLTRTLGPTDYGRFAFALAFASLFSVCFDFGLSTAVTREFAREQASERYTVHLLAIKLVLAAAGLALAAVGAWTVIGDPRLRHLAVVLASYVMVIEGSNTLYAIFRARQRMEVEAFGRVAQGSLLGLAVVGVMAVRPSVVGVAWSYLGTSLAVLAGLAIVWAQSGFGARQPTQHPIGVWRRFLSTGLYIALLRVAGDGIIYVDSVLLGFWNQIDEVAWYNAALKVSGLFLLPMGLVSSAIFPTLVVLHRDSDGEFAWYWNAWLKGSLAAAVLIVVVVEASAERIVGLLFPATFAPAAPALRILALKVGLAYLHNAYFHALLVLGRERAACFALGSAAVLSLVMNLILIPRWSFYGAAVAAVVTHGVILAEYAVIAEWGKGLVRSGTGLGRTVAGTLLAGLATFAVVWSVQELGFPFLAAVLLGTAFYAGLVCVLTGWARAAQGAFAPDWPRVWARHRPSGEDAGG